jgi:hypothetical protein
MSHRDEGASVGNPDHHRRRIALAFVLVSYLLGIVPSTDLRKRRNRGDCLSHLTWSSE